jgi:hypothetical protein
MELLSYMLMSFMLELPVLVPTAPLVLPGLSALLLPKDVVLRLHFARNIWALLLPLFFLFLFFVITLV